VSACLVSFVALAQQAQDEPAFEVASVKASDPNPSNPMWISGVRLAAPSATLASYVEILSRFTAGRLWI
jgi:hypothetical protein